MCWGKLATLSVIAFIQPIELSTLLGRSRIIAGRAIENDASTLDPNKKAEYDSQLNAAESLDLAQLEEATPALADQLNKKLDEAQQALHKPIQHDKPRTETLLAWTETLARLRGKKKECYEKLAECEIDAKQRKEYFDTANVSKDLFASDYPLSLCSLPLEEIKAQVTELQSETDKLTKKHPIKERFATELREEKHDVTKPEIEMSEDQKKYETEMLALRDELQKKINTAIYCLEVFFSSSPDAPAKKASALKTLHLIHQCSQAQLTLKIAVWNKALDTLIELAKPYITSILLSLIDLYKKSYPLEKSETEATQNKINNLLIILSNLPNMKGDSLRSLIFDFIQWKSTITQLESSLEETKRQIRERIVLLNILDKLEQKNDHWEEQERIAICFQSETCKQHFARLALHDSEEEIDRYFIELNKLSKTLGIPFLKKTKISQKSVLEEMDDINHELKQKIIDIFLSLVKKQINKLNLSPEDEKKYHEEATKLYENEEFREFPIFINTLHGVAPQKKGNWAAFHSAPKGTKRIVGATQATHSTSPKKSKR